MVYVFGFAIDWQAVPEATEHANMPLFVGITVVDKLVFFLGHREDIDDGRTWIDGAGNSSKKKKK